MRALGVVRRQFTNRGSVLRAGCQKAISRARVAAFTAWATAALPSQARWVLAQQAVAEKSNEITAISDLLAVLDLRGAVVSIDAMGCQKAMADPTAR